MLTFTRGYNPILIPLNHHFPMVFPWFPRVSYDPNDNDNFQLLPTSLKGHVPWSPGLGSAPSGRVRRRRRRRARRDRRAGRWLLGNQLPLGFKSTKKHGDWSFVVGFSGFNQEFVINKKHGDFGDFWIDFVEITWALEFVVGIDFVDRLTWSLQFLLDFLDSTKN